jgi:protein-S-isoprenylcysteine O-methyltransferase Ste14
MRVACVTDVMIIACWVGLLVDNLRMARREGMVRVGTRRSPSLVARLGVLALLLSGVALLERRTGAPLGFHPLAALAGIGCALTGLLLHGWGRRALGERWASVVAPPADRRPVTRGPYAIVRHPIYLGVLLLAVGTVLAHPSVATLCVAGGLVAGMARKISAEERVLRAACGAAWERYAATVPMLVPRPSALLRRAWR